MHVTVLTEALNDCMSHVGNRLSLTCGTWVMQAARDNEFGEIVRCWDCGSGHLRTRSRRIHVGAGISFLKKSGADVGNFTKAAFARKSQEQRLVPALATQE